jgi:hypothetical protein
LHAAGDYAFRGKVTAGVVNGQLGATATIFAERKRIWPAR